MSHFVHYYEKIYNCITGKIYLSPPCIGEKVKDTEYGALLVLYDIMWPHDDNCGCVECGIPSGVATVQYWGVDSSHGMPDQFWTWLPEREEQAIGSRFSAICDLMANETILSNFSGRISSSLEIKHQFEARKNAAIDVMPYGEESGLVVFLEAGWKIIVLGPK